MFSIVCLFAWMPAHYNFHVAVMRVFRITDTQLVCLRIRSQDNLLIFSVVSEEVFHRLSEFFCRILYFPIAGINILECFAYPELPQFQFIRMSAHPTEGMADTLNGYLSTLGNVLYQRRLSFTDSIGVVLYRNGRNRNQTNDSAVPHTSQRHLGNGQENQQAARAVPNVPVAGPSSGGTAYLVPRGRTPVGLQKLINAPGRHYYLGTFQIRPGLQGPQVRFYRARNRRPYGPNIRGRQGRSGHRNQSSTGARPIPRQPQAPVEENPVAQGPSRNDERQSENPKVKIENQESSSDSDE